MGHISLAIDVTDALPIEITDGKKIAIAAWLFFPDDTASLGTKPMLLTLLHGGSYDKRYFHCEIPGYTDYSAAQHLASLGNIVLVPDLLGVGESSKAANQKKASRQIVALANHSAVEHVLRRLRLGTLHATLPPFLECSKIGIGHSMGGMLTITQQAEYRTYDAVMILGFTTLGVHFTIKGNRVRAGDPCPDLVPEDYTLGSREYLHETFHWDDISPEIIAFDDSLAVPTPSTIGLAALKGSVIAADAARIDVPVCICMGERDVSPDPRAEILNYTGSCDIALYVLSRSGHCHNFASTRHRLWNRIHNWSHYATGNSA